jgi:hypothetical protein
VVVASGFVSGIDLERSVVAASTVSPVSLAGVEVGVGSGCGHIVAVVGSRGRVVVGIAAAALAGLQGKPVVDAAAVVGPRRVNTPVGVWGCTAMAEVVRGTGLEGVAVAGRAVVAAAASAFFARLRCRRSIRLLPSFSAFGVLDSVSLAIRCLNAQECVEVAGE